MLFYRLLDCPKVNFGPLSTFGPLKGVKRNMKNILSRQKWFFRKKSFFGGVILGPKMMASLNSGCNINIRASVHMCKLVSSSQDYQKYSRRLFYIYRKSSWKMLLPSGAISHCLASIFIDSSFFLRDYNSSLRFLRSIHNISGWYAFSWTL